VCLFLNEIFYLIENFLVKFDKSGSSASFTNKQVNDEDEQSQIITTTPTTTTDATVKPQDTNLTKKPKQPVNKIH
jgi:hypothetical protein